MTVPLISAALGDGRGPLSMWAIDRATKRSFVAWAETADELIAEATAADQAGCDTYWGVAPRRLRLPDGRRGGKEDCLPPCVLWLDLDVFGPGHPGADCPNVEAAEGWLASLPIAPSAIVRSGYGVQAYWLLRAPISGDVSSILERWGAWLRGQCPWKLDSVFNVDRIMRVPGTQNRKGSSPVRSEMSFWTGELHDQADIEALFPPAEWDLPNAGTHESDPLTERFDREIPCGRVLAAAGWTEHGAFWKHPTASNMHSAQVYPDENRIQIYTTSIPTLPPGQYGSYRLWAHLNHGGQTAEARIAAKELLGVSDESASEPNSGKRPFEFTHLRFPGERPPKLDLDVLPLFMREFAANLSEQLQVSSDSVAQALIGALAIPATGRVMVAQASGHEEPCNLYLALVLPSGAGKSQIDKATIAPIAEAIRERRSSFANSVRERKARRVEAKARKTALERSDGKKGPPTPAERDELTELIRVLDEPEPADFDLIVEDINAPTLVRFADRQQGRVAMVQSEPHLFEVLLQKGGSEVLSAYLKGWDGGSYTFHRTGTPDDRTAIKMESFNMTMQVCAQPSIIGALMENASLGSRGFTPRFMFVIPDAPMIDEERWLEPAQMSGKGRYTSEMRSFCRMLWNNTDDEPIRLTVSHSAARVWIDWAKKITAEMHGTTMLPWWSKARSSVTRLAGLFHLADGGAINGFIGEETMRRACTVGSWWVAHAMTMHGRWGAAGHPAAALFLQHRGSASFTAEGEAVKQGIELGWWAVDKKTVTFNPGIEGVPWDYDGGYPTFLEPPPFGNEPAAWWEED